MSAQAFLRAQTNQQWAQRTPFVLSLAPRPQALQGALLALPAWYAPILETETRARKTKAIYGEPSWYTLPR